VNIGVSIEISANLPLPDIHYESRRRRFRTQQYNNTVNTEGLEHCENIIDLLDFEDVFEYFDEVEREVESLVEQTVLEDIDLPAITLKRPLCAIETTLEVEALV